MWAWLKRKRRNRYTFEHERGAKHTVTAVCEEQARAKMRKFLQRMMFGNWALTYYPHLVDEEMEKCRIVNVEEPA